MSENKGSYFSKTNIKLTATETSRKVEFDIPEHELENVTAGLIKKNHLRGLYSDFCILNQEFLKYVLTIGLKGRAWEVFIFLLYKMDKDNKILINNQFLANELNQTKGQISKAIALLEKNKVILRQKIGTSKYEVELNYDILNPQLAFKGKADNKTINKHRALISNETPYIKQYNTNGGIDLINGKTGEVFDSKSKLE